MAKAIYVGVSGVARKVKQPFIGVSNVARKVKSGYIGVGGVARQFFTCEYKWKKYKVVTTTSYEAVEWRTGAEYWDIRPSGRSHHKYGGLNNINNSTGKFISLGIKEYDYDYEEERYGDTPPRYWLVDDAHEIHGIPEGRWKLDVVLDYQSITETDYLFYNTVNLDGHYDPLLVDYGKLYKTTKSTTNSRGDYVGDVFSSISNAYPTNGIHTDGYWYVKQ